MTPISWKEMYERRSIAYNEFKSLIMKLKQMSYEFKSLYELDKDQLKYLKAELYKIINCINIRLDEVQYPLVYTNKKIDFGKGQVTGFFIKPEECTIIDLKGTADKRWFIGQKVTGLLMTDDWVCDHKWTYIPLDTVGCLLNKKKNIWIDGNCNIINKGQL